MNTNNASGKPKAAVKKEKDLYPRHVRRWRFLYAIAHRYIIRKFNIIPEEIPVDGPFLLIPNHVTNWDPLIVGMSLKRRQAYFVATEHIFRLGFLTKLLQFFFAPIARPKGGSSLDAIRKMMDHLKKGHSVCLFAEGEATWDGQSQPIFPATGKLVRMAGVPLVTLRIEGGYLSLPRWGKGKRKGVVRTHVVHVYTPEELKKMDARAINAAIEADIFEDAYARQKEQSVAYRGKTPAEKLESLLYFCPECKKLGTLRSEGDRLSCACGLTLRYTDEGLFDPDKPFENVLPWVKWQQEALTDLYHEALSRPEDAPLFFDEGIVFNRVSANHEVTPFGALKLMQFKDRLQLGEHAFPLTEITDMAMVQECRLLFTSGGKYYEAISEKHSGTNLRKYLGLYQISRKEAHG